MCPRGEAKRRREAKTLVRMKKREGVPVSEICTAARIPCRTFCDWWRRYHQHGLDELEPRSRRPCTIHRTSSRIVNEIVSVREETRRCPHKIAGYLRTQGRPAGHMTVYRILCSSGLNRPLQKPRVKRSYIRWQRKHRNSLWQCDLKLVGPRWLITILDDYSRFVTASELFKEGTAENTI